MDYKTLFIVGYLGVCFFSGMFSRNVLGAVLIWLLATVMLFSSKAKADTYYSFRYNTPDQLKISTPATDRLEARTKASKLCFDILTKKTYPGEEAGLKIIDICVNPLN